MDVLHIKGNVVDALPFLFDVFGYGAVWPGAFQQFDLVGAGGKKGGFYPFRGHLFFLIRAFPKQLAEQFIGGFQVLYGDPYMFYFPHNFQHLCLYAAVP